MATMTSQMALRISRTVIIGRHLLVQRTLAYL